MKKKENGDVERTSNRSLDFVAFDDSERASQVKERDGDFYLLYCEAMKLLYV